MFGNSSESEMDIDKGRTRPKEPNLAEIRKKLLFMRTTEAFTDYDSIMSDSTLSSVQKIVKLQEAINDTTRRKIHFQICRDNYLKIAFMNQRKPTRERWSRSISRNNGHSSYINCIN